MPQVEFFDNIVADIRILTLGADGVVPTSETILKNAFPIDVSTIELTHENEDLLAVTVQMAYEDHYEQGLTETISDVVGGVGDIIDEASDFLRNL